MQDEPTTQQTSLLKTRLAGAVMALAGFALTGSSIYSSIETARRTGQFSLPRHHPVVLGTFLFYAGIAILSTDCRDGVIRCVGPDGRRRYTRKGRTVVLSILAATAITIAAIFTWYGP